MSQDIFLLGYTLLYPTCLTLYWNVFLLTGNILYRCNTNLVSNSLILNKYFIHIELLNYKWLNNAFIWCQIVNNGQLMLREQATWPVNRRFVQQGAAYTMGFLQRSRFRTHSIRTIPASINSNNQISRSGHICSSWPAAIPLLMSKTNHLVPVPLNPNSRIYPVVLDLIHHPNVISQWSKSSVEPKPFPIPGLSLWVYEIV